MKQAYKQKYPFVYLVVGICLLFAYANNSDAATSTGSTNSLLQYEQNHLGTNSGYDNCFTTGKIANYLDFNNTSIPPTLGKGANANVNYTGMLVPEIVLVQIDNAMAAGLIGAFTFGIGAVVYAAAEYATMVDYCSGAFAYTAAERVSKYLGYIQGDGSACCNSNGTLTYGTLSNSTCNLNTNVLTSNTVPWIFHCDPGWDPTYQTSGWWGAEVDQTSSYFGYTWGYMGANTEPCQNMVALAATQATSNPGAASTTGNNASQGWCGSTATGLQGYLECNVATIEIGYMSQYLRDMLAGTQFIGSILTNLQISSAYPTAPKTCEFNRYADITLYPGEYVHANGPWGAIDAYAYYRQDPANGQIQLCAAQPFTLLPVLLGCTTVAAPTSIVAIDPFLLAFVQNTRCIYITQPRTDLASLGNSFKSPNAPVVKFLLSDMHFTSTIVGCIEDMLNKIFMQPMTGQTTTFFENIQQNLKQAILAALTLYIALVGMKIITSAEPPKRHEWIMYAVKFGIVSYFTLGNAWYNTVAGQPSGMYPALIAASQEIVSLFVQAQNINDPFQFCQYEYNNANIFTDQQIPAASPLVPTVTIGTPNTNILVTVWDLIDCKIANYLNFGTCNFSITGMFAIWMPLASLWSGGTGIIFGVCCIIYTMFILITFFRYTNVFILVLFAITIMVFISPIFFVLWLFEPTKQMFNEWCRMLLGYILLPGLLFAFITLMLSTFDAIYYGSMSLSSLKLNDTGALNQLSTICQGSNSMFCTVSSLYSVGGTNFVNPCTTAVSNLTTSFIAYLDIGGLFSVPYLINTAANALWLPMLQIMLFAFLFYLFLDKIITFMSQLVGVKDLGNISSSFGGMLGAGSSATASSAISATKVAASTAASAAATAGKAAANMVRG
ncbi:MAG: type IV secretion system protein [Rickettsiales bacterium]